MTKENYIEILKQTIEVLEGSTEDLDNYQRGYIAGIIYSYKSVIKDLQKLE